MGEKYPYRIVAITTVTILSAIIGTGTVLFKYLEDWTWIQSFYFTIITITTVGYGDLVPTRDTTRLITAIFIIGGVGIAAAVVSLYGSEVVKRRVKKKIKK